VITRLHDIHTPLPAAKSELFARAEDLTPETRPGDYAQAVMDLGATICTPKSPACGLCPWREPCRARRAGTAHELPKKTPKAPKPIRHGTVFLARRSDGAWLLETRPDKGLLGGMMGWPGSDWVAADHPLPEEDPPCPGPWHLTDGEVRHTFTHFHLVLHVFHAQVPLDTEPLRGRFLEPATFRPSDLPTVMRKALNLLK
jgi:A/G-specific adenine glycosylase